MKQGKSERDSRKTLKRGGCDYIFSTVRLIGEVCRLDCQCDQTSARHCFGANRVLAGLPGRRTSTLAGRAHPGAVRDRHNLLSAPHKGGSTALGDDIPHPSTQEALPCPE